MGAAASLTLLAALAAVPAAAADFDYVGALPPGAAVVDARAAARCAAASLPGARCIPAAELLGPHRRLASFRDILWLLGTAGLSGEEHVVVAGDPGAERDFLAGVLYLAGQRRVSVLTRPLAGQSGLAPGQGRGAVRSVVYQAPMRDALLVLKAELAALADPWLLDGRPEAEFWGERVRAARGGHLPGAESLPAAELRAALGAGRPPAFGSDMAPIAYAQDAVDGIAYFTLLRAGAGLAARVYAGGWAEWAADGGLPADAATYPAWAERKEER